jgi:hypothetical protein
VRSYKLAVAIERDLACTTIPSPTEEAAKFHDKRDILGA